jgi:hypothetical protein
LAAAATVGAVLLMANGRFAMAVFLPLSSDCAVPTQPGAPPAWAALALWG